ncbi:MAG: hypothetical protein K9G48_15825 [Reyranella sp.]|nr:hypothetical protein [Reyranella sp.]
MTYDPSWDRPHKPSSDLNWQESDCYWFYDARAGVGGFHRIGQRPNAGTGQITAFAFARDGERFVLNDSYTRDRSINAADRWETGHRVAGHTAEALGDGRMRFTWNEPDSEANLEFYESFHPPRNWSKTGHSDGFMSNINSDGHLECSGKLRGRLRIGAATYDIDALCHRDRSWGYRDNGSVSMHRYRMFSGTVGPELSFASFLLDLKTGQKMVAGFVSRHGIDLDVRDLRVVTAFDADGLSAMGATAVLTLENGETVKIACEGVQGFMTPVPDAGAASSDTISTFSYEGKTGFLDLELSTNPGRGQYVPTQSDLTLLAIDQGLSRCVSYDL